ncbi:MAG: hypothetical protein U5J96_13955 [Ignavibacteriaceae bacterium]|nr:hypothetical protein [Ignavibacteriaceae bacterium]
MGHTRERVKQPEGGRKHAGVRRRREDTKATQRIAQEGSKEVGAYLVGLRYISLTPM